LGWKKCSAPGFWWSPGCTHLPKLAQLQKQNEVERQG
jgi:hypothetical protein